MLGLSRRAYGKKRGCSDRTVRNRIDDGTLKDAILADGTIDAEIADRLLAAKTVRGKRTPSGLNAARQRKLAARVALIADEVGALRDSVVDTKAAGPEVARMMKYCADRFYVVADRAAPLAVGQQATEAADIIYSEIVAALTELSSTTVEASEEATPDPEPTEGMSFGSLTYTELAAMKADLEAARMEIQRQLNKGDMVTLDAIQHMVADSMSNARGRFLGVHVKIAPYAITNSEEELRLLLEADISEAVEELACRWVNVGDLTQGRNRSWNLARKKGTPSNDRTA